MVDGCFEAGKDRRCSSRAISEAVGSLTILCYCLGEQDVEPIETFRLMCGVVVLAMTTVGGLVVGLS